MAKWRLLKRTVGHGSKHPFSYPAVTVSSGHDEIGVRIFRQTNETVSIGLSRVNTNVGFTFRAVTPQVCRDIADPSTCPVLLVRRADLYDRYLGRARKERQRITHSEARFSGIFPANQVAISLQL